MSFRQNSGGGPTPEFWRIRLRERAADLARVVAAAQVVGLARAAEVEVLRVALKDIEAPDEQLVRLGLS